MVVGIGADGLAGIGAAARHAIETADVLFGSERQLALVGAASDARRVSWPSPLLPALPTLLEAHPGQVRCVLASGDPMFFGIGATLVRLLGADQVRVLPHPSSMSLACARLGWPIETVETVSVVGRPIASVRRVLRSGQRVLVLGLDAATPAAVATLLVGSGYGASTLSVLSQLGGADESRVDGTAAEWSPAAIADLNVIAIECRLDFGARALPEVPGLPDDAYRSDGQLTKREVRAVTMSSLAPLPGELLWDVGAGSGSIGIEWLRSHRTCRAIAIESDAERAERIRENADALGVPSLDVVHGSAPAALAYLPTPDAVFIGGGLTASGQLEACWQALRSGGRLVVNAVTVESEAAVAAGYARLGGELTRIEISRSSPVGAFTGWRPAMPVTQWLVGKP
jgi:precorrin-6Y C5,15-methyltransferase (decarboxylating)